MFDPTLSLKKKKQPVVYNYVHTYLDEPFDLENEYAEVLKNPIDRKTKRTNEEYKPIRACFPFP